MNGIVGEARDARRRAPANRLYLFPITGTSPDIRHITPQRRTAPSHHTAPPRPHHRTPRLRNAVPHRTALPLCAMSDTLIDL